ncbi:MAG: hypothetical protein VKL60_06570 [Sphaerospermopsis sp.]|nr:hypothetical protein [Sphaerospermopsis sp.]
MNLYFLVEGRSTERKVYPAWLKYLLPELKRVNSYDEVDKNNYYLFGCNGYNSVISTHLPNAIADIHENGKYSYLVICIDAEENTISYVQQEIDDLLTSKNIEMQGVKLVPIIQNRCLETWFLGNRKIYTRNPQDNPLLEYTRYYDISLNCPECMGKHQNFNTHAQFHEAYLKELFRVKKLSYSKNKPGEVLKEHYLQQLLVRIKDNTDHLPTFKAFVDFCNMVRPKLTS